MKAIVVTAFRIPLWKGKEFVACNSAEMADAGAMICFNREYPADMPIFSIARAANYGIRRAIDDGAEVVMKTDIDVVFLDNLKALLDVDDNTAIVPQYGDVADYESRHDILKILPRGQGTICMTARNWKKLQGYDERYIGWGGEDNELCRRIKRAGIRIDNSQVVAHLHHDKKWNCDNFNPRMHAEHRRIKPLAPGAQPNWGIKTLCP